MSFSALDRYYVKLFEVNLDFFIFYFLLWQDSTPYLGTKCALFHPFYIQ